MNVQELAAQCCAAILTGQHITLSLPKGARWPAKFPRGDLLSVGTNGSRNVSHDPLRVLAWVQRATLDAQTIHPGFVPTETTMVPMHTPDLEAPRRCAAGRDGDCTHKLCPQLRDNEPHHSGRHCPLDIDDDGA